MKHSNTTRVLAEGAVMVALAVVLNFLKVDIFPSGGSINLLFIPLMVYALRRGAGWGIGAGFVFGTIKCLIGGGIAYGWQSLLLDYAVAYALVGLAGLFPKKPMLGTLAGTLGCLASVVVSGVLIWGVYMPETFWGLPMTNVWVYSLLYNGSYVLCNGLIAAVAIRILSRSTKLLTAEK